MQENVDTRMTNKAPSYPRAQCVSMELMLSKLDNNTAPAATSLKIESQTRQHNTPISVILQTYKVNILTWGLILYFIHHISPFWELQSYIHSACLGQKKHQILWKQRKVIIIWILQATLHLIVKRNHLDISERETQATWIHIDGL